MSARKKPPGKRAAGTAKIAASPGPRKVAHCPQLLGERIEDADRARCLGALAGRLSLQLPEAMAAMFAGSRPQVTCGERRQIKAGELDKACEDYTSASVFALGSGGPIVSVLIAKADILRLTDRLFGGTGELPDPLPEKLPMTADLVLARLDQALGEGLADDDRTHDAEGTRPQLLRRTRDASKFIDGENPSSDCKLLDIAVTEPGRESWNLVLGVRDTALDKMARNSADRAGRAKKRPVAPDPRVAPYADIPFDVTATLLEMTLPFDRLSDLKVGDRLPVAIPRRVDLALAGRVLASGTIGTREDRVALRLTRTS